MSVLICLELFSFFFIPEALHVARIIHSLLRYMIMGKDHIPDTKVSA